MGYWRQKADEMLGNPPTKVNSLEPLVVQDKVVRPQVSFR